MMDWMNVRLQQVMPHLAEKLQEVFTQMERGREGKIAETVETYYDRMINKVREEALLAGELKGKLEGIEEGELKGKLEFARRLLADGQFSVEKIADLTELTIEQVSTLTAN
jgi:predicted transposase/invertase (TIGR01784 family)